MANYLITVECNKMFLLVENENPYELEIKSYNDIKHLDTTGNWKISVQRTKKSKPCSLSVSAWSLYALLPYFKYEILKNNYKAYATNGIDTVNFELA